MCLLCFVPPKEWPKKKHLKTACRNNPDGFGFAIAVGSEIIVRKSMDSNELIEEFYDLRSDNKDCPALFHARLATHGSKNLDNCHPFAVTGDEQIIMAHNGILPVLMDKDKVRSDTKIFAEDYMTKMGVESLDDQIGFDIIQEYCSGNKLVFLNASNKLKYQWYIVNETNGVYEKKVWYSNSGYDDNKPVWNSKTYTPYSSNFYGNLVESEKACRKKATDYDYYDDDYACDTCWQSYDNLDDHKYMYGCDECGLKHNEIWQIYDRMMMEEEAEGYELGYGNIHSAPLSKVWSESV